MSAKNAGMQHWADRDCPTCTRQDTEDAAKWRALMSCDRIRMVGRTNDLNHAGFEFWFRHPEAHPSADYPQEGCRELLERFVARIRGLA